jgi:phosphoglycerol transferase
MEEAMPPGGMIFQLPATSYPEIGTTQRMPDYAHLACHPYSKTLRWSYGTCRNRRWDEWQQHVGRLTTAQMVRALCLAEFDGVYVDRRGYADNADALITELRELLGTELVVSDSGDQMLFTLATAKQSLRSSMDESTWQKESSLLLNRPCVLCQDGFLRWATVMPPEPRRATHHATMRIINPGDAPRRVRITVLWQRHTAHEINVQVHCGTLGIDQNESPPMKRAPLVLEISVPPGEHIVHFDSTPKPIGLPRMYTAWNATEVKLETTD